MTSASAFANGMHRDRHRRIQSMVAIGSGRWLEVSRDLSLRLVKTAVCANIENAFL